MSGGPGLLSLWIESHADSLIPPHRHPRMVLLSLRWSVMRPSGTPRVISSFIYPHRLFARPPWRPSGAKLLCPHIHCHEGTPGIRPTSRGCASYRPPDLRGRGSGVGWRPERRDTGGPLPLQPEPEPQPVPRRAVRMPRGRGGPHGRGRRRWPGGQGADPPPGPATAHVLDTPAAVGSTVDESIGCLLASYVPIGEWFSVKKAKPRETSEGHLMFKSIQNHAKGSIAATKRTKRKLVRAVF